jgi:hypothetical protein
MTSNFWIARRGLLVFVISLTFLSQFTLLIQRTPLGGAAYLPNADFFLEDKDTRRWDNQESVPLFAWERASADSRTCRPQPSSISTSCCLGSTSNGGNVFWRAEFCESVHMSTYERVESHANAFLAAHPPRKANASLCDLCRIVDLLVLHNLTLTWQGDSMTSQVVTAMECEFRRRGYVVNAQGDKKMYPYRNASTFWRFGIRHTYNLTISVPEDPSRSARVQYFNMYKPIPGDMREVRFFVGELHDSVKTTFQL